MQTLTLTFVKLKQYECVVKFQPNNKRDIPLTNKDQETTKK